MSMLARQCKHAYIHRYLSTATSPRRRMNRATNAAPPVADNSVKPHAYPPPPRARVRVGRPSAAAHVQPRHTIQTDRAQPCVQGVRLILSVCLLVSSVAGFFALLQYAKINVALSLTIVVGVNVCLAGVLLLIIILKAPSQVRSPLCPHSALRIRCSSRPALACAPVLSASSARGDEYLLHAAGRAAHAALACYLWGVLL